MKHSRFVILCVSLFALRTVTASCAGEYPLVDAAEFRPRGGLPNTFARLIAGQELRVAYIGGSITAADGWRPKTTAWLQSQYPKSKIIETDAAIGGTGSDLGVFRFRQDVLEHRPHLVFVEFAVNDGGAPPEQIYRCMEGMVRQAWREDPSIDICFVYTLVDSWAAQIASGKFPRAASATEKIADHYQIPSIHMGIEVARLAAEGKLILKADPRTDAEKAALAGKMIFSADGVHPHAQTGHQLYLESIARSFDKMKANAAPRPHELKEPFAADNYERARLVPLASAQLVGNWAKLDPERDNPARWFHKFIPVLYRAGEASPSLTFRFKGTMVGFIDLLGPDCGVVRVQVDDLPAQDVARFDAFCTYHRIGSFAAAQGLPDTVHTVRVSISDKPLDKAAILTRNGNRIDDPKRYSGRHWYVGSIMLIGEPPTP